MRLWYLVFVASPAFVLIMPGGHSVWPVLLAVVGLFYASAPHAENRYTTDHEVRRSWTWLLGGFLLFVSTSIFLGLWHGNDWGYYEMFIPFLLFPAIAWLIRAGRWEPSWWFIAVGTGALLACAYACYQIFGLGMTRAMGALKHPIPFGNTAIVLAAVSLLAAVLYPFSPKVRVYARFFLVICGLAGVFASLLSGSKGGWPSLLIIAVVLGYLATAQWARGARHLAALGAVLVITTAAFLAPSHVVKDRLVTGINGAVHWLETGNVVDDSVSIRFEIWKLSLHIISEKPWLGHGTEGSLERWKEKLDGGLYHPKLVAYAASDAKIRPGENEILSALLGGGVLGALALFSAYAGIWLSFWRWRNHTDQTIKTCSTIGLLLVPLYLEFGLSVAVMHTNTFRTVFVTFAVVMLSFITVRQYRLLAQVPQKN
ncbi:MAG: O-antigen ligase family protein [Burkholderiaceae bacterium]